MRALLLVDIQNDFLPGGALAVPQGNEIIPLVQELIHYPFDLVVATKDWHPADHGSFFNNHPGKKGGDCVDLAGVNQVLWPPHCIQGTWGAEFAPGWDTTCVDKIIYKGEDASIDSYSTFFDNAERRSTGLEVYLKEKSIKEIYVAGLATDYCVKYSVLDAIQLGFLPYVIVDACRGINLNSDDCHEALQVMRKAGAVLLPFQEVKNVLESQRKAP